MANLAARRLYGRKFTSGVFGAIAGYAAYSSYLAAQKLKQKEDQIAEHLEKFDPISLKGLDAKIYPWFRKDNLSDWE